MIWLTHISMNYESTKNAHFLRHHFAPPSGYFLWDSMCQINPIEVNFTLQKCLEIFYKNSADKIQLKNYKEVNPPCLMPIKVKAP